MRRRNNKKQSGGKSSSRKQKTTATNYVNQVTHQLFYEQPFVVTQASSGTGGISSTGGGSGASITSVGYVAVDPFTIGGRFAFMAGMFAQYKINYIKFTFIPDASATGYLENIAGGTTTPVMINRDFAWCLIKDSADSATMTATQILISGGRYSSTTRRSTLSVRNLPWMFTTTTSSYVLPPTGVDFRTVAPLALRFAYRQASTTGTQQYGDIMMEANVSFRGPLVYAATIGVSPSLPDGGKESKSDEQKSDSPVIISSQSKSQSHITSFSLISSKK